MVEKVFYEDQPQSENQNGEDAAEGVSTVQLKFNKETIDVPIERAKELAQKGMKFEKISNDFEKLKNLAAKKSMTVPEFLKFSENTMERKRFSELMEQSGGNRELAEHILELEGVKPADTDADFSELKEQFPEINEIGELPEEVRENSALKGRNLLDEYLRYLHKEKREEAKKKENSWERERSAIGSQRSRTAHIGENEAAEFINGVWKR